MVHREIRARAAHEKPRTDYKASIGAIGPGGQANSHLHSCKF